MVKSDLGPADQTSRECAHFCELALGSITEEPMQNGSHMFEVRHHVLAGGWAFGLLAHVTVVGL